MINFYCYNCDMELSEDEEYCPVCEIPVINNTSKKRSIYICPVCESKNPVGERKCNYCCSIL